jgi:hypothetical protein
MGYYMGDYYGGGSYYRGDPFWGFVGRAVRGAVKLATGFGGGKAAAPVIKQLAASPAAAGRAAIIPRVLGAGGALVASGGAAVGRMVAKHPVLSAAGAAAVLGTGLGGGIESMMAPGVAPHGMHYSHKTHHLVKNRHMRVTNPKALRRAIRRTHGFARLAMKTIHLVHPKKKARFGGFRRRRAKK